MKFCKKLGKPILICINTIFMKLGWILIGGGVCILNSDTKDSFWNSSVGQISLPTLFIIIGCITTFIAVLGIWGGATDKKLMLKLYASILLVAVLIQICLGIYYGIRVAAKVRDLKEAFTNYEDIKTLDAIHLTYECCGYDKPDSMKDLFGSYRSSCCGYIYGGHFCSKPIYNTGCYDKFTDMRIKVGIVYSVLVGFEILCCVLAYYIAFFIPKKRNDDTLILIIEDL